MAEVRQGAKVSPYIILETLPSKGGMAIVCRAGSDHTASEVALKISKADVADPRFNNALKQEVDVLKLLSHPGIVRILPLPLPGAKQDAYMARALELRGQPWFYAMEFLHGGSLDKLIGHGKMLPFPLTCAIATRLVDAVTYLHAKGIAHLDIKPENILFRYSPEKGASLEPVLIDFGVAARIKNPVTVGGSLHTMAPEQLRQTRGEYPPEMPLGLEKMDIYSLGVVTYRMWTSNYPFGGITSRSLSSAVLHAAIKPPRKHNPSLPAETDAFMVRWLAKEPYRRPPLDELKRYLYYWSEGVSQFPDLHTIRRPKKR